MLHPTYQSEDAAGKANMSPFIIFTSESVCAGHPDKICDQISDAIVDAVLKQNPNGRAAIETLVTKNRVVIAGEVKTDRPINYQKIAREQIKRLGYTDPKFKFTNKAQIDVFVHSQSSEIARGVDQAGAGDQGMMFGLACGETESLMPLPITLSHALARKIDESRENKTLAYLRPDGKTQVSIGYKNNQPQKITQVILAVPHAENIPLEKVKTDLYKKVVVPVLEKFGYSLPKKNLIVNGTGVWHIGGPTSDAGVTGRKIVVDTYGGYARVGGGAFSGKDPTKVDRSGAYAARFIAKNIVAHQLAKRAEVRLSYCIGQPKPLMQEVETFGTAQKSVAVIADFTKKLIDTSVTGILETLDLRKPIYLPTAAYGHFGRKEFSWEKIVDLYP